MNNVPQDFPLVNALFGKIFMTVKYWKSQKNPHFLKVRRNNLEHMLDFLNANIGTMGKDQLMDLVETYTRFIGGGQQGPPFSQFMQDHGYYFGGLGPNSSVGVLKERSQFLAELQSHLREIIEASIRGVNSGETLYLCNIQRRVVVEPSLDRFIEEALVEKIQSQDALEDEKRKIDIVFANIIRDLDLKPSRFRICLKCRKVFYQPTSRGKNFCSARCAGAVRQARYEKRKREKAKVST
jgi:hypothetical protein